VLLCLVITWAMPTLAVQSAGIYGYTGDDGSVHLSNVPDDARYAAVVLEPVVKAAQPAPAPVPDSGAGAIQPLIANAAREHRVDAALLQAMVTVESAFATRAVSSKGAMGLMQLMPDTASRYGVTDLFDPAQNLDAGARHLRYLLERYHCDLTLALAAYNAGEGAVKRHGNAIPPYRETVAYVPKVLRLYEKHRNSASAPVHGASPEGEYSLCPMGPGKLAANL
jgi:soluble lytic murein transglycosylase-like protein